MGGGGGAVSAVIAVIARLQSKSTVVNRQITWRRSRGYCRECCSGSHNRIVVAKIVRVLQTEQNSVWMETSPRRFEDGSGRELASGKEGFWAEYLAGTIAAAGQTVNSVNTAHTAHWMYTP